MVTVEFSASARKPQPVAGSYQLDAIAFTVRTRSHAERRFMFRFKRYDETCSPAKPSPLLAGKKLVARQIGESDRAPVAMLLLVKR